MSPERWHQQAAGWALGSLPLFNPPQTLGVRGRNRGETIESQAELDCLDAGLWGDRGSSSLCPAGSSAGLQNSPGV